MTEIPCQDCWARFTPLCFSVDGMLGTEAGFLCADLLMFYEGSGRSPTEL